ncbi:hypothetical protein BGZ89_006373, partial [Linnemannia elongata]
MVVARVLVSLLMISTAFCGVPCVVTFKGRSNTRYCYFNSRQADSCGSAAQYYKEQLGGDLTKNSNCEYLLSNIRTDLITLRNTCFYLNDANYA